MGLDPADVGVRLQMIVPGQEQVTLFLRKPAPLNDQFTQYSLDGARRRPQTMTNDTGNQNIIPVVKAQWDLYRPYLDSAGVPAGTVPAWKDYLIDSEGTKWVVAENGAKSLVSFIELQCYQGV